MAVPFRRTSKTAKRKRRTHYKLNGLNLVVCPVTKNLTLSHRVTPNSGYYKNNLYLNNDKKDKDNKKDNVKN